MHTKRLIHVLLLCVALAVFVPLYEHVTAQPAHAATGNTYYVGAGGGVAATPAMASLPRRHRHPIVPGRRSLVSIA